MIILISFWNARWREKSEEERQIGRGKDRKRRERRREYGGDGAKWRFIEIPHKYSIYGFSAFAFITKRPLCH